MPEVPDASAGSEDLLGLRMRHHRLAAACLASSLVLVLAGCVVHPASNVDEGADLPRQRCRLTTRRDEEGKPQIAADVGANRLRTPNLLSASWISCLLGPTG